MDVYGEGGKRAAAVNAVGVGMGADTEDEVDNLEVYEAMVNPQESKPNQNKGGQGMMPPMMMGGAGGQGQAAASAGMSSNVAAANQAGAMARQVPTGGVVGGPVGAPVASPGVAAAGGAPSGTAGVGVGGISGIGGGVGGGVGGLGLGAGAGAGAGIAAGVAASGVDNTTLTDEFSGEVAPQTGDIVGDGSGDSTADDGGDDQTGSKDPGGPEDGNAPRANPPVEVDQPPTRTDVVTIDPVEIKRVSKEWSQLSDGMADLSASFTNLQAGDDDFGMVRAPKKHYDAMTSGLQHMAGGASAEFGQISAGLEATNRSFQETEDQAASSIGGLSA